MKTHISFLFLSSFLITGCQNEITSAPHETKITINRYVSQVSDTLPYRLSKTDQGKEVNYVVSSSPVVENALSKDSSLSVYSNIRTLFSEKYGTKGFPQAGLFIKKSLANDKSRSTDIFSFLSTVDDTLENLISNPESVKDFIDGARPDIDQQKSKLGRSSS